MAESQTAVVDMGSDPEAPKGDPNAIGVTAVVVTHNSARHLAVLGAALASSSLAPTRKLIVDNASVDDTVACASASGFEVLKNKSNDGFGAACNAGLRATLTEFVLFCNPDVLPSSTAVEQLAAALRHNSAAAIAGAPLDDHHRARRFSRLSGTVWGFLPGWLQRRAHRFGQSIRIDPRSDSIVVDFTVGAFVLCRAAALRSVGGFDESFFLYSEEEDLSRRLGKSGWQTLLVPTAMVAHGHSESSEGVTKAVMAPFRFHSLYWYYRRYHSRLYAEFARCTIGICVMLDRAYRSATGRQQVYGKEAAIAPFRSIEAIRMDYEQNTTRRVRRP